MDTDADGSETQDKVPGITLVAQLKLMVAMLKFKLDVDNTSTSVVSEFGLDQNQDHQEEDTQEENAGSELQDRVLTTQDLGHQLIHSSLTGTTITSEAEP